MAEPDTEALRARQATRVREERSLAHGTDEPAEEHAHERRAERAAYLAEKLEERAESEERARGAP